MTEHFPIESRELWPDLVKVFACVLVVLGHFTQSMVKSGFLNGGALYEWFQLTVYAFHVPLFFICSGYLYQKYSRVDSFDSWRLNVRKKAISLGVPYVAFTLVTLVFKTFAGGLANSVEGDPLQTLLFHPTAPYWFLYTLFFVFLIIPTAWSQVSMAGMLAGSIALKLVYTIGEGLPSMPYAVDSVSINLIWFVIGMTIAFYGIDKCFTYRSSLVGLAFLPMSYAAKVRTLGSFAWFIVGLLACACIVSSCVTWSRERSESGIFTAIAQWTMPVFLMHTIFAAGIRVMLLKIGVTASAVHIAVGLAAGFVGPVFAMLAMERLRPLDFLIYPTRYVKPGRNI